MSEWQAGGLFRIWKYDAQSCLKFGHSAGYCHGHGLRALSFEPYRYVRRVHTFQVRANVATHSRYMHSGRLCQAPAVIFDGQPMV